MMCAPAAVIFIEVDAGWVIKIRSEDKVNPEGPGVDSEGAVGLSKRKAPQAEVSLEVDPGQTAGWCRRNFRSLPACRGSRPACRSGAAVHTASDQHAVSTLVSSSLLPVAMEGHSVPP